jgi:hypothetical protein
MYQSVALTNQGLIQQVGKYSFRPQMFYAVMQKSNGLHPCYDVTKSLSENWGFASDRAASAWFSDKL